MKFLLLVEGKTESVALPDFFKRWLDPQLPKSVKIQIVKFNGYSDFDKNAVTKAQMHLNGPKQSEIIAAIGLLDLYGPNFFPSHAATVKQKYDWGKSHYEKAVENERFRMFFAVHETEAWLLSQPEIFPSEVRNAFPKKIRRPEKVNFTEPPAKLLDRIYKQKLGQNYKKTTYGKTLFSDLDPKIAVSKCPYLKTMLEEMLSLAENAVQ